MGIKTTTWVRITQSIYERALHQARIEEKDFSSLVERALIAELNGIGIDAGASPALRSETPARKTWPESTLSRFEFLSFPLDELASNTGIRAADFYINAGAKRTRYPIRGLRYWWVYHALKRFAHGRPLLAIVDMGAENGQMKRYCDGAREALCSECLRWIAVDWRPSPLLQDVGYHEIVQCDFASSLALPDGSADVVICLHVMEHLPDPGLAMREIARVLRPGGLLLAGSPTAPEWLCPFIEWRFKREFRSGKKQPGGHINSLSPTRWRKLVENAGLTSRLITGTHFIRASGKPSENWKLWVRLNLLWGALFPSLGSEIYVCALKPPNRDSG